MIKDSSTYVYLLPTRIYMPANINHLKGKLNLENYFIFNGFNEVFHFIQLAF